jgi:hypothetical protein
MQHLRNQSVASRPSSFPSIHSEFQSESQPTSPVVSQQSELFHSSTSYRRPEVGNLVSVMDVSNRILSQSSRLFYGLIHFKASFNRMNTAVQEAAIDSTVMNNSNRVDSATAPPSLSTSSNQPGTFDMLQYGSQFKEATHINTNNHIVRNAAFPELEKSQTFSADDHQKWIKLILADPTFPDYVKQVEAYWIKHFSD